MPVPFTDCARRIFFFFVSVLIMKLWEFLKCLECLWPYYQSNYQMSDVKSIVVDTSESKIRWAGHVACLADNRWISHVIEWYPHKRKRPLGRPPRRCVYYMEMVCRGRKKNRAGYAFTDLWLYLSNTKNCTLKARAIFGELWNVRGKWNEWKILCCEWLLLHLEVFHCTPKICQKYPPFPKKFSGSANLQNTCLNSRLFQILVPTYSTEKPIRGVSRKIAAVGSNRCSLILLCPFLPIQLCLL